MRPRLLDAYSGAGGCAVGYARAGFEVVGCDIRHQPHYPFEFVQADALCESCGKPLRYYNIGFDDGYKCDACGRIYETYGADGRRRDATDEKKPADSSPP